MASVVVVTGAFGALGTATVATLAAAGHAVAAIDRAPVPAGFDAAFARGGIDLTDADATRAAFADIVAALGPIAGLVNVAGGFVWEMVGEGSDAAFDAMYAANLRSAAVACAAVLPHLAADGAAIVNVGAAAERIAGAGMAAYAASKAGVRALTEALADELRARRVRVNLIQPTILDTPANRSGMPDADPAGWVSPAEAAAVVAFLLSPAASAVTGAAVLLSH